MESCRKSAVAVYNNIRAVAICCAAVEDIANAARITSNEAGVLRIRAVIAGLEAARLQNPCKEPQRIATHPFRGCHGHATTKFNLNASSTSPPSTANEANDNEGRV